LCCFEQTLPKVLSPDALEDLQKAVEQAIKMGVDVDRCVPSLLKAIRMTASDREAQAFYGQLSYTAPQLAPILKATAPQPSLSQKTRQIYLVGRIHRTVMDQVGKYFDDHNTLAKSMGVGMAYPSVPPWKSDEMLDSVVKSMCSSSSDANLKTAIDESGEVWVRNYTSTVLEDARRRMFPKVSS